MTCCSRWMSDEDYAVAADALDRDAIHSERDGCWVVRRVCLECGRLYEEELETARYMVRRGLNFRCLGCDVKASAVALVGLGIGAG